MEVNVLLFDDFDSLDAFGPAEVLGNAVGDFHLNYLSVPGNMINSMQGVKVWTEPLEPEEVSGIVLIPGGRWARRILFQDSEMLRLIKRAVSKAEYCMMVSSGAAIVSQTGLLYRRKIAECKVDENWRRMFMGGVSIVKGASWVSDGKYYSSSDSVSGIAMALAMVVDLVDLELAGRIAEKMGYDWDMEDERVFQ